MVPRTRPAQRARPRATGALMRGTSPSASRRSGGRCRLRGSCDPPAPGEFPALGALLLDLYVRSGLPDLAAQGHREAVVHCGEMAVDLRLRRGDEGTERGLQVVARPQRQPIT